jgi:hypothetical protein
VRIAGSTIKGSLVAVGVRAAADPLSSGANVICNTTVGGSLVVRGSSGSAPWSMGLCGGNTIGGSVTFSQNAAAGNLLSGNTVRGDLTCSGSGSVTASDNKVKGRAEGQCAA